MYLLEVFLIMIEICLAVEQFGRKISVSEDKADVNFVYVTFPFGVFSNIFIRFNTFLIYIIKSSLPDVASNLSYFQNFNFIF